MTRMNHISCEAMFDTSSNTICAARMRECRLELALDFVIAAKVSHLETYGSFDATFHIHDATIVNFHSKRFIKDKHSTTSVQSMVR